MLVSRLLPFFCYLLSGCATLRPETVYTDVSMDETGHRVYRTGVSWRFHHD